jgi:hypothetical protein
VAVHLAHGAIPDCDTCAKWLHGVDWRPAQRAGKPVPRPAGAGPPCFRCPKSRDGRPNPGADLKGRAWLAYRLYLAVRAGMPMPQDAIAVRNCAALRWAEDQADRQKGDLGTMLKVLFGAGR